jgi:hypothetical protein
MACSFDGSAAKSPDVILAISADEAAPFDKIVKIMERGQGGEGESCECFHEGSEQVRAIQFFLHPAMITRQRQRKSAPT